MQSHTESQLCYQVLKLLQLVMTFHLFTKGHHLVCIMNMVCRSTIRGVASSVSSNTPMPHFVSLSLLIWLQLFLAGTSPCSPLYQPAAWKVRRVDAQQQLACRHQHTLAHKTPGLPWQHTSPGQRLPSCQDRTADIHAGVSLELLLLSSLCPCCGRPAMRPHEYGCATQSSRAAGAPHNQRHAEDNRGQLKQRSGQAAQGVLSGMRPAPQLSVGPRHVAAPARYALPGSRPPVVVGGFLQICLQAMRDLWCRGHGPHSSAGCTGRGEAGA